jgi:hydroxylaminobenzene mutase
MELTAQERQGHRLVQAGVSLFLAALLIGLAIPTLAVPRLALSAHLVALLQAIYLIALGLVWPRLTLQDKVRGTMFAFVLYGSLGPVVASLLAALWRAGNTLLPMAAGDARGTSLQEAIIAGLLRSSGGALIVSTIVILWGLRLRR